MNRDPFVTSEIYHIYNRGTDKRSIFLDHVDWLRFAHDLFEFNDSNPALHALYKSEVSEVGARKKVIEVLAYCLMPNHYHLMVRQIEDGGITLFMRKLGTGYTMYFNKKYDRSGALFQGKFKSVAVVRDAQLRYLPHYIHANPSDGLGSNEVERIAQYSFSSAPTYLNRNPYDYIIDPGFLRELYPDGYPAAFRDWLSAKQIDELTGVTLD